MEEFYTEYDNGYHDAVYNDVKPWGDVKGWTFPYWCGVRIAYEDKRSKAFITSNAVRVWIGESTWEELLSK